MSDLDDRDEREFRDLAARMRPNGPDDPEDRHPLLPTRDRLGTREVRCPVTGAPGPGYFYLSQRRTVDDRPRQICEQCMTGEERADNVLNVGDLPPGTDAARRRE
jgi:hypothetical protein